MILLAVMVLAVILKLLQTSSLDDEDPLPRVSPKQFLSDDDGLCWALHSCYIKTEVFFSFWSYFNHKISQILYLYVL